MYLFFTFGCQEKKNLNNDQDNQGNKRFRSLKTGNQNKPIKSSAMNATTFNRSSAQGINQNREHPKNAGRALPIRIGLSLLAVMLSVNAVQAAVSVSPDIAYFYSDGPGEGLSVSSDGLLLMVSSPVAGPGGAFTSSVPQAIHAPWTPQVFFPTPPPLYLG